MVSTVLLIDDSTFLRRANERSLTRLGYRVITAADGEEGLRLAGEKIPDVIVLDMMLPKLGGPELLQMLKSDPRTATIPVIVLSALSQKNDQKLIAGGAVAYLEKSTLDFAQPSNPLAETISTVLNLASKSSVCFRQACVT
jgi:CheY-like chemotaxis protein